MPSTPSTSSREIRLDQDQLRYLKEVLGLRGVLIPENLPFERSAEPGVSEWEPALRQKGEVSQARLVVLASSPSEEFPLEGAVAELAEKMIQAMKLSLGAVAWIEWRHAAGSLGPSELVDLVLSAGEKPVLIFGPDAAHSLTGIDLAIGEWTYWQGVKLMPTHSPGELLSSPDKKKEAWSHLQAVMKIL